MYTCTLVGSVLPFLLHNNWNGEREFCQLFPESFQIAVPPSPPTAKLITACTRVASMMGKLFGRDMTRRGKLPHHPPSSLVYLRGQTGQTLPHARTDTTKLAITGLIGVI